LTGARDPGELVPSGQAGALLIGTLIPAMALLVLGGGASRSAARGGTSARLHVNLVFFFSLVAAIPDAAGRGLRELPVPVGVQFWFSTTAADSRERQRAGAGLLRRKPAQVGATTLAMAFDLRSFLQSATLLSPDFQEGYALQVPAP
jgi:two-component system nitrogen regulation sensor histidine kinase NtrY